MEIYTSGDIAFLESIWTGLGHLWNGGYLRPVFASALMLNFFSGIIKWIFDQKQPLFANFWQSILIYLIFFTSTTTVYLVKDDEGTRAIAGNFPIGFVAPASWLTTAGHSIANEFKSAITAVNVGYGYSSNNTLLEHGVEPLELLVRMRNSRVNAMALNKSNLLSDANDPSNADSGLSLSVGNYYEACVVKYLVLAKSQPSKQAMFDKVMAANQAQDYWANFRVDQSSWPVTIRLDGTTTNTNCADAYSDISTVLVNRSKKMAMAAVGALNGLNSNNSTMDTADRVTKLEDVVAGMDPLGDSTAVYKLQTNAWAADLMGGACKESNLLGPEFRQSCRQQWQAIQDRRSTEASKAESFKEMVGPLVTFVEGFVYMITPLLLVIILFMGGAALKLMGKYMSALMWVILMPICQVAVDVYLNVYFNKWYYAVQADPAGVNLWSVASQETHWQQLESFVAFAGTAQAMVPALAMFIIFAGVHTLQGLGAAASGGGTVSAGSVNPNINADAKAGSVTYGNDKQMMTRSADGSYTQSIGVSNSVRSANDSDFALKLDSQYGVNQMKTATASQAATAGAAIDQAYAKTYTDAVSNGTAIDRSVMAETGRAQQAAMKASMVDSLARSFNLSDSERRDLSEMMTVQKTGSGEVSIALQAKAEQQLGGSLGKLVGALGGPTAKIEGGIGLGAKANVAISEQGGENNTTSESASEEQKAAHNVQRAFDETNTMLKNWKHSYKEGESGSDGQEFRDAVSETGKTTADYKEVEQHANTIAERQQALSAASASTGDAIIAGSKKAAGFGALIGSLNGNDLGQSGIDKARDTMLEKLGGPELSGIDSRNITQKQADYLNENMSDKDKEALSQLGLTLNDEGKFEAGKDNFMDDKEFVSKVTGMSVEHLDQLSDTKIEDKLESTNSSDLGDYQQDRVKALSKLFTHVNDMQKNVDAEHADEALAASGAFFTHEGSVNVGGAGNLSGGRLDSLASYGTLQTDMSELALNGKDREAIEDVELNENVAEIREVGAKAVEKNLPDLIEGLGDFDGQSGESLVAGEAQVKSDFTGLQTEVQKKTDDVDNIDNGTFTPTNEGDLAPGTIKPVDPKVAALGEQLETEQQSLDTDTGNVETTAKQVLKVGREDKADDNTAMTNDLLETGMTQKDFTQVQTVANIDQAKEAYRAGENVNSFVSDEIQKDGSYVDKEELNEVLTSYDSNDNGESQDRLEALLSKSYSAEDANKLAAQYQDQRSDFDTKKSAVDGNEGATKVYDLISNNNRLMDSDDTEDFRQQLQRYKSVDALHESALENQGNNVDSSTDEPGMLSKGLGLMGELGVPGLDKYTSKIADVDLNEVKDDGDSDGENETQSNASMNRAARRRGH